MARWWPHLPDLFNFPNMHLMSCYMTTQSKALVCQLLCQKLEFETVFSTVLSPLHCSQSTDWYHKEWMSCFIIQPHLGMVWILGLEYMVQFRLKCLIFTTCAKEFWETIRNMECLTTTSYIGGFGAKIGHLENSPLSSWCVQNRLNRYTHTIFRLCVCWWEHATSSRSPKNRQILFNEQHIPSRSEILGDSGLNDLSTLMHHSVILIRTWLTIKVSVFIQVCVSRILPALSTHRLSEGDHPCLRWKKIYWIWI